MEAVIWAAIAGTAGTFFTYLLSRRKSSGRVAVTDAELLWKEATAARRELRRRIKDLEANEIARRIEIHTLRNELTKLHFVIAGNVPQDLQDRLMEASRDHIRALEVMLIAKQAENAGDDGTWGRRFGDHIETADMPTYDKHGEETPYH